MNTAAAATGSAPARPLYPGIEQRGRVAVATSSGAILAVAPDPWPDGCPTLTRQLTAALPERIWTR